MEKRIVLATTTFYRSVDDIRLQLAEQWARRVKQEMFPAVIVDGSRDEAVRERIRSWGIQVLDEVGGKGMGPNRRQALERAGELAGGGRCVVWTEPEKHDLVQFMDRICQPIIDGEADMVIPHRTEASFRTYPPLQVAEEKLGNMIFNELTRTHRPNGVTYDPWIGPRGMNATSLNYFLKYNDRYGGMWDSIFIPVLRAIWDKATIGSVSVEYRHSPEQVLEESGNLVLAIDKRLSQLDNLGCALREEWERLCTRPRGAPLAEDHLKHVHGLEE